MSDIKMCDICGEIFPITQEGWSAHEQTIFLAKDDHSPTRPKITLHACPKCSGAHGTVTPRLPQLPTATPPSSPPGSMPNL